jgi:hypothetical protein
MLWSEIHKKGNTAKVVDLFRYVANTCTKVVVNEKNTSLFCGHYENVSAKIVGLPLFRVWQGTSMMQKQNFDSKYLL